MLKNTVGQDNNTIQSATQNQLNTMHCVCVEMAGKGCVYVCVWIGRVCVWIGGKGRVCAWMQGGKGWVCVEMGGYTSVLSATVPYTRQQYCEHPNE